MKKSFLRNIRFAGLVLVSSMAMVSCYEGDDNKVDYTIPEKPTETVLPDAKYYLYCTVEDVNGNALNAKVTVYFNGAEIASQNTQSGSINKEVTAQGAGSYSVKVEADGYVTVTKPAQPMYEVAKGNTGILNFSIVMRKLGDVVNDPTSVVFAESITEQAKSELLAKVVASCAGATLTGATINADEIAAEATVATVNGQQVAAIAVTTPVALVAPNTAKTIELEVPVHTGYVYDHFAKATKATNPEDEWVRQANAFFGVNEAGLKLVCNKVVYNNPAKNIVNGYKLTEIFLIRDLTFLCGEALDPYAATAVNPISASLEMLFADDSHDNHDNHDDSHDDGHDDSHDDHHDNGGTAWGGGTTGR